MPSLKHLFSLVALSFMAWKGISAAPIPEQTQALQLFGDDFDALDDDRRALRRRSLASDIDPVLSDVKPLAQGVDAGLQKGEGNIKDALRDAGSSLGQVVNTAAGVVGDTEKGLGQTVGEVPEQVHQTLEAIDHNPGIIGDLDKVLLG